MNIMMTLGGFQFGISTAAYQELSRTTEYRWPAQERFMQNPALQFVGPGGDTINLPGVIYPHFSGGTGQLDAMRALAAKGTPQTLIDGSGRVMGEWVIERVEEKQTVFAFAGAPRKQEFTLGLRKFSDGVGGGGLAGSLLGGVSMASGIAVPTSALTSLASLTTSVSSQSGGFAASLTDSLNKVSAAGAQIGGLISSVLSPISRAIDVATNLKTAATDAKRLLGAVPTNLSGISSAARLVNAASSAVNNAGAAGTMLQRSLTDLAALSTVTSDTTRAVQDALVTVNRLTVAATNTESEASRIRKIMEGATLT